MKRLKLLGIFFVVVSAFAIPLLACGESGGLAPNGGSYAEFGVTAPNGSDYATIKVHWQVRGDGHSWLVGVSSSEDCITAPITQESVAIPREGKTTSVTFRLTSEGKYLPLQLLFTHDGYSGNNLTSTNWKK